MSFGIIIQARYNSTRFKGKIFHKIGRFPLLELLILRLKKVKNTKIIIAAPLTEGIDTKRKFENLSRKHCVDIFYGSEKNVLKRYYDCSKFYKLKNIVRITSDCPLSDPNIIKNSIKIFSKLNLDYLTNTLIPTYPDGLDVEIFNFKSLEKVIKNNPSKLTKEHVTHEFKINDYFKKKNFSLNQDFSRSRLTVDYKDDLKIIRQIISKKGIYANFSKIKKYLIKNKNITNKYYRNTKFEELNYGQKIWINAKDKILNGNMLISKNPEYILPGLWPTYFKKSKGIEIVGIDNKKYKDLFNMSVGTNILGYSNKRINAKVLQAVKEGNMTTFNPIEEYLLAKKLLSFHSWANKVKFAKTGGEANTIALRIARCSAKKENIAFCGYHGWHDWYLSSNLNSKKNLDTHLLPGIEAKGIPKNLKNTVFPFEYGDYKNLNNFFEKKKIGVVILELARQKAIDTNFLKRLMTICKRKKIVTIFDECTSGFRENLGGLHLKYNLKPDLVTYGKALGSGFSITAILGNASVMKNAENNFISSTFWSDKVGFVAAIETLNIFEREKCYRKIVNLGKFIKKEWLKIAKKNNLEIEVGGLNALPMFVIKNYDMRVIKTFITQEMLRYNILASNVIYISYAHNKKDFVQYFKILDRIFQKVTKENVVIDKELAKNFINRQN